MKRESMPIVDILEVTAAGLRERGLSRVALFGTRFTIETGLFGALDGARLGAWRIVYISCTQGAKGSWDDGLRCHPAHAAGN